MLNPYLGGEEAAAKPQKRESSALACSCVRCLAAKKDHKVLR